MIRVATQADRVEISELVAEFNTRTGNKTTGDVVLETVDMMIAEQLVLVSEYANRITGVIAGRLFWSELDQCHAAQEVLWYDTGGSGGLLYRALIREARSRGAQVLYMTVLEQSGEKAHRLVQALGATLLERTYHMKL